MTTAETCHLGNLDMLVIGTGLLVLCLLALGVVSVALWGLFYGLNYVGAACVEKWRRDRNPKDQASLKS